MKISVKRLFEALSPLLVLFVHGLLYNPLGTLAGQRGMDFSPFLKTPLDALVPYLPIFVIPYLFIWFFPIVLTGFLFWKLGIHDSSPYLRLALALLVLMGSCYVIWLLLPVQVDLRLPETALRQSGWLGELTLLNYSVATQWNACPSFHVACPWFLYRALQQHLPGRHPIFLALALSIIFSTVFIRIHYLADIVCGIVISELIFRCVLQRLEQMRLFQANDLTQEHHSL